MSIIGRLFYDTNTLKAELIKKGRYNNLISMLLRFIAIKERAFPLAFWMWIDNIFPSV